MSYTAPLDDMRFVLTHLAGLPEIATFAGFEEAEPELVEAVLTEAARFAADVLAPLNGPGWVSGGVPAIRRGRLARDAGKPQHRRPGHAGRGVQRRRGDVEVR
jgi:hypothetical protein